jgi:hypothetical protein
MKVKINKYPKGSTPRTIDVQIEKFDTYSLDHTLALIIYPALIQLKNTKHGVPHSVVEDVGGESYQSQQCFDFYKETHDMAFEIGCKRWDVILDKMIWSFEQLLKDDFDSLYHHGEAKYDWVTSDKKFANPLSGKIEDTYQMVDTNPDEHWYDVEGHHLHQNRVQEGLELFGKYFQNLWD